MTSPAPVWSEGAAAGGFEVHWGRCWDGGGAPVLWPWGRIVDELARERDLDWFEDGLGSRGRLLARIAPDLAARLDAVGMSAPQFERERFMVLDALGTLVRYAAGEQPLLLAFDDIDLADGDALAALSSWHARLPTCRYCSSARTRAARSALR